MNRLIISGLALSEPGTMGGNSKITLEIARHASATSEVHLFLPRYKLPTVTDNVPAAPGLVLHPLADFAGCDKFRPLTSSHHYQRLLAAEFAALGAGPGDVVFGCSDFHLDVLPMAALQRRFRFKWLPSVFLFVPGVGDNLRQGYGFPVAKYALYRVYQRRLLNTMLRGASGFVITNDCDRREFPARFADRLFPFYGGVNVEQLPREPVPRTRDVVYCSRLHPQKGLLPFLDAWQRVVAADPTRHLTVIGNGERGYESQLRARARALGIAASIDWLGYVNNEEKYRLYASARLFVHPTVYDNNGMVAAEALCSGLPVVMFDLENLRHVYDVGCTKVPCRDYAAFARAILANPRAPAAGEVAALREQWAWAARVRRFLDFASRL